jgi:hypothetical protein
MLKVQSFIRISNDFVCELFFDIKMVVARMTTFFGHHRLRWFWSAYVHVQYPQGLGFRERIGENN